MVFVFGKLHIGSGYTPSYMNKLLRIPLNTTAAQFERLLSLQKVFSQVCNQLAPEVSRSRVWNRVALHHLHYRTLREQ